MSNHPDFNKFAKVAATLPLDHPTRATAHTSSVVDFGNLEEIQEELEEMAPEASANCAETETD